MTIRFLSLLSGFVAPSRQSTLQSTLMVLWLVISGVAAQAASRPGVPRPLMPALGAEEVGRSESVLEGESVSAAIDQGGARALYFVRRSGGTRNLWMATPVSGNTSPRGSRAVRWQTRPLTRLSPPLWADQPTAMPDGRSVLCLTNAVAPDGKRSDNEEANSGRIALLDIDSGRFQALSEAGASAADPVLSPDGTRVAFVINRAGYEAIYVMPAGGGDARQVVKWARRPCWLDAETLLFQSSSPQRRGLFRVAFSADGVASRAQLFLSDGREAAVEPRGRLVCAVADGTSADGNRADGARDGNSHLVLLAADGSGARVLSETRGARHPIFNSDGSAIFFDAPLLSARAENASGSNRTLRRGLWSLPMLRVPPVALLQDVRPALLKSANGAAMSGSSGVGANAISVIGTAFSEENGALDVRLEVASGAGDEKANWTAVPIRNATVQSDVLATWTPPRGARNEWTLRLSVSDAGGDRAQSTLSVLLPLLKPFDPAQIRIANAQNSRRQIVDAPPIQSRTSRDATKPNSLDDGTESNRSRIAAQPTPLPPTKPRPVAAAGSTRRRPPSRGTVVPMLPLPALPPPPDESFSQSAPSDDSILGQVSSAVASASPNSTASPSFSSREAKARDGENPIAERRRTRPNRSSVRNRTTLRAPEAEGREAVPPPEPEGTNAASPSTTNPATVPTRSTRGAPIVPVLPPVKTAPSPTDSEASTARDNDNPDTAFIDVSGTPAVLASGTTARVEVTLRNLGRNTWNANGERPVRLMVRWVDRNSGTRRRWAYNWLRAPVAGGTTAKLSFSITAPPQPGQYRLVYALIRLQEGNANVPPATDPTAQRRWPGEFGSAIYAVRVE